MARADAAERLEERRVISDDQGRAESLGFVEDRAREIDGEEHASDRAVLAPVGSSKRPTLSHASANSSGARSSMCRTAAESVSGHGDDVTPRVEIVSRRVAIAGADRGARTPRTKALARKQGGCS